MKWAFADVGAIAAGRQKDEFYWRRMEEMLKMAVTDYLPPTWAYRVNWSQVARLLYYGLSIGCGQRTLGEEYAHLLPVDVHRGAHLARWQRFLLVLGQTVDAPPWWNDFITPFHMVWFYWTGRYAEWMRRLLGIRYVQYPRQIPSTSPTDWMYRGVAMTAALVALQRIYYWWGEAKFQDVKFSFPTFISLQKVLGKKIIDEQHRVEDKMPDETTICRLCLEGRKHTTITPCGHLFCWECIMPWLEVTPRCPLCRQACEPSHLFCIME